MYLNDMVSMNDLASTSQQVQKDKFREMTGHLIARLKCLFSQVRSPFVGKRKGK